MITVAQTRCWFGLMLMLLVAMSQASPFEQGSKSLSIVLGSGRAFDDNYTIVGAGFGYYVLDGLELGFEAQRWLSGDPSITKVSPYMQYVYMGNRDLMPYAGVFFRRTYIDGFEDLDSAGGRAGLVFASQPGYYLSAGMVYESYLDCNTTVFLSCSDTYPELSFVFLF